MTAAKSAPRTVDRYIAAAPPKVRPILRKVRRTILRAAPEARETISYRIPAYSLNGTLVYFAAFKSHIGLYPPVRGDAALERAASAFANEKGNLRFPLDRPIPYSLIERIVRFRVKQNGKAAASLKKRR
jgi:uncharacterized protein YdhG (YjbR/CyaY superfamily)